LLPASPRGWVLLLGILATYSVGALAAGCIEAVKHQQPSLLLLVLLFPVLHLTYGFGSLAGLAKLLWSGVERRSHSHITRLL
jgi:hypothetical protein